VSSSQPKKPKPHKLDLRLEQRRAEAVERKAERAKLSPEDQLARLEARPGESKRERAKLLSAIDSRRKVTAKKEKT
jgi:hypothetical protein